MTDTVTKKELDNVVNNLSKNIIVTENNLSKNIIGTENNLNNNIIATGNNLQKQIDLNYDSLKYLALNNIKLAVITHSNGPESASYPFFWGPYHQNLKSQAKILNVNLKIYSIGGKTDAELEEYGKETLSYDIIALTGVPKIIEKIYDPIIKNSGKPHYFFNAEPPNYPSQDTKYLAYIGQYEGGGATGKNLAINLKNNNNKKYTICFLSEPEETHPGGPQALRLKGIKETFGEENFIAVTDPATFTFDENDPLFNYFNNKFIDDIASFNAENNNEIVLIGISPVYYSYMANLGNNINFAGFDTLPEFTSPPTNWLQISFQNPKEQANSVIEFSQNYLRNKSKKIIFTGPTLLGNYRVVPPAEQQNFEINFLN